ncbi:MAG: hypothetical protein EZS28_052320, partial [Streblomastix strix]
MQTISEALEIPETLDLIIKILDNNHTESVSLTQFHILRAILSGLHGTEQLPRKTKWFSTDNSTAFTIQGQYLLGFISFENFIFTTTVESTGWVGAIGIFSSDIFVDLISCQFEGLATKNFVLVDTTEICSIQGCDFATDSIVDDP